VPAVALTAYARTQDRTQAMLAGFQTHLSKPVDPSELIATVASLAGRTGRTSEIGGGEPSNEDSRSS
jgi:CheY-like chemotaxis protein